MDQLDLFGNPISDKPADKKKVVMQEKNVAFPKEAISPTKVITQAKEVTQKDPIAKVEPPVFEEPNMAEITNTPENKVDEKNLERVYYTITEVAKMFEVNASLLRFWEKEFKQLGKIKKNKKGDRYYNKENIRHLNIIYYLLKVRKMTIAGARDSLKNKRKSTVAQFDLVENLQKIRGFLVDLKTSVQEEK